MSAWVRCGAVLLSPRGGPLLTGCRPLSLRSLRDSSSRPAAWPYKERGFGGLHSLLDKTSKRLDENSKVVVVEGPLAAGKAALAKALAQELDMLYVPPATSDMLYRNTYGFDLRSLDTQLPQSLRSYDEASFHRQPKHVNTACFQLEMYYLRYFQYVDALAHLLNTGQGVVLTRCAFSDSVFLEAMAQEGFVSPGARSVYHEVRANTLPELLRPHLVVYLDVGVEEVRRRVSARGRAQERDSRVLAPDCSFLLSMERAYKQAYLREMGEHAELLVYDWSGGGADPEVVAEDVARLDLDSYDKASSKSRDWRQAHEDDWAELRRLYTSEQYHLDCLFNVPRFDVPELVVSGDDIFRFRQVWWCAPGMQYAPGFNQDQGDRGLLWKMR